MYASLYHVCKAKELLSLTTTFQRKLLTFTGVWNVNEWLLWNIFLCIAHVWKHNVVSLCLVKSPLKINLTVYHKKVFENDKAIVLEYPFNFVLSHSWVSKNVITPTLIKRFNQTYKPLPLLEHENTFRQMW